MSKTDLARRLKLALINENIEELSSIADECVTFQTNDVEEARELAALNTEVIKLLRKKQDDTSIAMEKMRKLKKYISANKKGYL